jgi:tetratricopeptide (TPR) repeat protein
MKHLWGWALGLLLVGCEVAKPGENELACTCEAGARPVDLALLSFLSKARAAHHQADLAEAQGDRGRAVTALEAVVQGPAPLRRQESNEVLADTWARLAGLRAAQGQFDAAMQDIERGLELAREVSYFRGHLFEVQAVVEEQRAASLAASPEAAAQARARAIRAAEQAIEIQDQVLREALKREPK